MKLFLLLFFITVLFSESSAQPIDKIYKKTGRTKPLSASHARLTSTEICGNNVDDDGNGLTDQNDFYCYFNSSHTSCVKNPVIWGCTGSSELVWVNIETGVEHVVGNMGSVMMDITWASNGKLYGVGGSPNGVWEIDPNTASAHYIAALPDGYLAGNSLTADADGNLYIVVYSLTFNIYIIRLNIATWKACFIADINAANLWSGGDLSFLDGNLYLACGASQIVKVDVQTGVFTAYDVKNASTGAYYGLINGGDGYFYASDSREVYRIDPVTMKSESLPAYTFTYPGAYLYGMASYSETCNTSKCTARANIFSSGESPFCVGSKVELKAETSCNVGTGTYVWTTPSGSLITTSEIAATTKGMYYLKYQISPSCSALDSFFVDFVASPKVNLGADTILCANNVITLDANIANASYLWQDGSRNRKLTVQTPGLHWVAVTVNGCTAADSITISYRSLPVVSLGNDTSLCSQDSIVMNVYDPLLQSYTWQDGSAQPTYTAQATGMYKVAVIDKNGCTNSDSVHVEVKPTPSFSLGKDTALCGQQQLSISVSPSFTRYKWSTGETDHAIDISAAGTYWLEAALDGCSARDSITIVSKPVPYAHLGRDTMLCEGSSIILDATNLNALYVWQDNSASPTYRVTKPGAYYVKVDRDGCVMADTVQIGYRYKPRFSLGNDTTICTGHEMVLQPQVDNASYLWHNGSTSHSCKVKDEGKYSVTITNDCGSTVDEILIQRNSCRLYLPNAFTPNNDGKNDLFRIKDPTFVKTFQMTIYNRWGQVVFASNNPGKGWNGTYMGRNEPEGNYIWQVQLTTQEGKSESATGNVILIR